MLSIESHVHAQTEAANALPHGVVLDISPNEQSPFRGSDGKLGLQGESHCANIVVAEQRYASNHTSTDLIQVALFGARISLFSRSGAVQFRPLAKDQACPALVVRGLQAESDARGG